MCTWKTQFDTEAFVILMDFHSCVRREQVRQAFSHVSNSQACSARSNGVGVIRILQNNFEDFALPPRRNGNRAAVHEWRDSMADGILDKRLNQQWRDWTVAAIGVNFEFNLEPVTEP